MGTVQNARGIPDRKVPAGPFPAYRIAISLRHNRDLDRILLLSCSSSFLHRSFPRRTESLSSEIHTPVSTRLSKIGSRRNLRFWFESKVFHFSVIQAPYLLNWIIDLPMFPLCDDPGQSLADYFALDGASVGEDDPDRRRHFPHFLSIRLKTSYSPTPRMYTIVRVVNNDGSRNEVTMEEEKYIDETAGTNFIYSPPIVRSEARGSRRALLQK